MAQDKKIKKGDGSVVLKVQRSLNISRSDNEILTKLAGRVTERTGARQSVSHVLSLLISQAHPKSDAAAAAQYLANSVHTPPIIQRVTCNVHNELKAMLAEKSANKGAKNDL